MQRKQIQALRRRCSYFRRECEANNNNLATSPLSLGWGRVISLIGARLERPPVSSDARYESHGSSSLNSDKLFSSRGTKSRRPPSSFREAVLLNLRRLRLRQSTLQLTITTSRKEGGRGSVVRIPVVSGVTKNLPCGPLKD